MSTLGSVMTESERRTMPVRIEVEALEAAKIAAAFKGISVVQYISNVLKEAADRDIEEGYRARAAGNDPSSPPAKPRRPKGG